MKLRYAFLAALLLSVAASSSAQANLITGSLPLVGFTVTENGSDLSTSTLISAADTLVSGPGTGDYSIVPLSTSFGPVTIDLTMAATGFGISLNNSSYGNFAASSGTIVTHTSDFLNIVVLGVFTPSIPDFPSGTLPNSTELRISVNKTGDSLSEAITLKSPPSVPEPSTSVIAGLGLVGLCLYSRFRKWRSH